MNDGNEMSLLEQIRELEEIAQMTENSGISFPDFRVQGEAAQEDAPR